MNSWLYPTTVFFSAFVVWILGILFFKKRAFTVCLFISSFLGLTGLAMLFFNGYGALAITLLCIVFFLLLLHVGFDISFSKAKTQGPFASYLHKEGIATTYLDPKGEVEVGGQKIAAITEGLMVAKGMKIRVIRCANKYVVVEKWESE
ncbi:MAG: NfeD family protein [Candidatus Brocadiae bacterium]|nr:NfeD family protein [Candidatus Brocadiia bacterium]